MEAITQKFSRGAYRYSLVEGITNDAGNGNYEITVSRVSATCAADELGKPSVSVFGFCLFPVPWMTYSEPLWEEYEKAGWTETDVDDFDRKDSKSYISRLALTLKWRMLQEGYEDLAHNVSDTLGLILNDLPRWVPGDGNEFFWWEMTFGIPGQAHDSLEGEAYWTLQRILLTLLKDKGTKIREGFNPNQQGVITGTWGKSRFCAFVDLAQHDDHLIEGFAISKAKSLPYLQEVG